MDGGVFPTNVFSLFICECKVHVVFSNETYFVEQVFAIAMLASITKTLGGFELKPNTITTELRR